MARLISGRVVSGKGEANQIVSLGWVKKQILDKLGFQPYPGTLNLKLSRRGIILLKRYLSKTEGIAISKPGKESVGGMCYRVLVMRKFSGALVFPNINGRREDVVEVISPYFLRRDLQLEDEDEVLIELL
ncbi:MAG: DUF120 domain-containing protein [Thermoproteota archaeon]